LRPDCTVFICGFVHSFGCDSAAVLLRIRTCVFLDKIHGGSSLECASFLWTSHASLVNQTCTRQVWGGTGPQFQLLFHLGGMGENQPGWALFANPWVMHPAKKMTPPQRERGWRT